ncbi:MAG: LAGLIDADG family homing endonuclease [Terriglobia bacterium]
MESDNPPGADNQQETADVCVVLDPEWVVGFVDGEGCFCVSVHRSSMMVRHGGWQLQPSFHVYQHNDHREVLEALVRFFGRVRPKGPKSQVSTFAVDGLRKLERVIPPFFEAHPPRVKGSDFRTFAVVVRSTRAREHLTPLGFERLVRHAYGMNARGKQRSRSVDDVLVGSSETGRGALGVFHPVSRRMS